MSESLPSENQQLTRYEKIKNYIYNKLLALLCKKKKKVESNDAKEVLMEEFLNMKIFREYNK